MIDNAFLHDVGLLQEDPRFEKQQHQKALMPLNKKVYFHIGVCVSIEIFVGELTHLFVFGVALSTSCFLKNSSSWCFLFFYRSIGRHFDRSFGRYLGWCYYKNWDFLYSRRRNWAVVLLNTKYIINAVSTTPTNICRWRL